MQWNIINAISKCRELPTGNSSLRVLPCGGVRTVMINTCPSDLRNGQSQCRLTIEDA